MTTQAPKPPLLFRRTRAMPCPYLDGRIERNLFTELRGAQAQHLHDRLALAGFRRSHHIVYRPACPGCSGCVPIRVPVARFEPTRSQQRVWNRNRDVRVADARPLATEEHYDLFCRYQRARHSGGEMAAMSSADFRAMIEDSAVRTELSSIRGADGRLLGACLADRLSSGLSAVYSYFDPDEDRRSLGTYSILRLIRRAAEAGLPFVYLGYWIEGCAKMAYKRRFRPLEFLDAGDWKPGPLPGTAEPR